MQEPLLDWDLAEQHLSEADFLCLVWQWSLEAPDYTLREVAEGPEQRLLAHLDGLVLGGPRVARRLLLPRLESNREEEVLASSLALLLAPGPEGLEAVLKTLSAEEPHQQAAALRALQLVPRPELAQLLPALLAKGVSPLLLASLLEVVRTWRIDLNIHLDQLVLHRQGPLAVSALRAARLWPERVSPGALRSALSSAQVEVRLAAMETGLILGMPEAWSACARELDEPGEGWAEAALLWALGAEEREAWRLLQALAEPELRRAAVWALGFSGWPAAAEALLEVMREEELAPLAAEAFCSVTGLRLVHRLARPEPEEGFGELSEREAATVSPESLLPWPVVAEVERWWQRHRSGLVQGQRYLRGRPWSFEGLLQCFAEGPMRRRHVWGRELAIRTRGLHLPATTAFSWRQRQELEALQREPGRPARGPFRELLRPVSAFMAQPTLPQPPPRSASSRPLTSGALALTGLGMVSATGHGAVESCAALRARLSRPRHLPYQVLRSDKPEVGQVVGHPLPGLVPGLHGLPLLLKLGALALEDLLHTSGLLREDEAAWRRTGVLLCLSPTRQEDWEFHDELLEEELPGRLMRHAGLPVPPRYTRVVPLGHAAGLAALQQAARWLRTGEVERAVVLAMDSLVGVEALEWLARRRQLKSPESAVGLMPGEAGAAVLLETTEVARRRGAAPLALLEAVEVAQSQPPAWPKGVESGRALAEVLRQAWPARAPMRELYADLNGEEGRAREWACAQVLLRSEYDIPATRLHCLAELLGDTGAASGVLALCAAARAFSRGYALGEEALVWSSSDTGEIAAARLSNPL